MLKNDARIWSTSPSGNPFFMSNVVDYGLGLIYGAMFGFMVQHPKAVVVPIDTCFGDIRDDVERTLRYW
eukprot:744605-Alexandrium_andersonii.AAC.1